MKWCIWFLSAAFLVFLYLLHYNRFLMFSVCENGKNNDAMISDWDCKAHSIAQLYIKSIWKPLFGCFLGNRKSSDRFWSTLQKQFSLCTMSGLFGHVRLIVFCSQGQEGTMLPATRATVSDGMCCTSYLILLWVRSREHAGKGSRRYVETREQHRDMAQMDIKGNSFQPRH